MREMRRRDAASVGEPEEGGQGNHSRRTSLHTPAHHEDSQLALESRCTIPRAQWGSYTHIKLATAGFLQEVAHGKEQRMTASGLESSLTSPKAYFLSTIFSAGKLEIITNQKGQQAAASQTPFVGWCWGSKREVICPKSQSHSDLPLDSKEKGRETSKNEAMSRKEKNTPQAKILWNKYRIF